MQCLHFHDSACVTHRQYDIIALFARDIRVFKGTKNSLFCFDRVWKRRGWVCIRCTGPQMIPYLDRIEMIAERKWYPSKWTANDPVQKINSLLDGPWCYGGSFNGFSLCVIGWFYIPRNVNLGNYIFFVIYHSVLPTLLQGLFSGLGRKKALGTRLSVFFLDGSPPNGFIKGDDVGIRFAIWHLD